MKDFCFLVAVIFKNILRLDYDAYPDYGQPGVQNQQLKEPPRKRFCKLKYFISHFKNLQKYNYFIVKKYVTKMPNSLKSCHVSKKFIESLSMIKIIADLF